MKRRAYVGVLVAAVAAVAAVAGCGVPGGAPGGDAAVDAPPPPADVDPTLPQLAHTAAAIHVDAMGEIATQCESWTLNNTETIYVNAVEFQATTGMHHSNWFWVPPSAFPGPDGTWPCASRGFDQGLAAATGGVLFAQTTQATRETQQFAPGVAIPIPRNARIVGQVHLLNASTAPLDVTYGLTLRTVPRDDVRVRLSGMYLEYIPLSIAPRARSSFTTTCDFEAASQQTLMRPLDFRIYYGLPHYHALGRRLRVTVVGGPNAGQVVYDGTSQIGDPAGRTLDPPLDLTGATGLQLTCEYMNPRDTTVRNGIGDQEMCMFLGFTDSPLLWAAGAPPGGTNTFTGEVDGVRTNTSACTRVLGAPAHW
jgi:hypothetical protein